MPDYNKIIAFFDEYIAHYREFLQFEYLKMDMLNHNQIEQLSASLSKEQAFIMKTNSYETKRLKLLEGVKGSTFAEIAENEGITRQGVRDAIKRAEAQLYDFEAHLGLSRKLGEMRDGFNEILELTDVIKDVNNRTVLSRDINDALARIRVVARMMCE